MTTVRGHMTLLFLVWILPLETVFNALKKVDKLVTDIKLNR